MFNINQRMLTNIKTKCYSISVPFKKGNNMAFEIDVENLVIAGYKGDSLSLAFEFDLDLAPYEVCFFVKRHINDSETSAVINKILQKSTEGLAELNLSAEETSKLGTSSNCFRDYYWSLKLKAQDNSVDTVIPNDFVSVPIFRVYP